MANNAILEYLELVSRERNPTGYSFFDQKKSFERIIPPTLPEPTHSRLQTPPRPTIARHPSSNFTDSPVNVSDSPPQLPSDLPIHDILLELQAAEQQADAAVFEPYVLHYWQLQRLLDVLRCSTPVLALPATIRANKTKIAKFTTDIDKEQSPSNRRDLESKKRELEVINRTLEDKVRAEREEMARGLRNQDKENVQSVLVLARLLNIVFRQGMSVPMLSDQLRLEAQQTECREILGECGILFDERFDRTFANHDSVQTTLPTNSGPRRPTVLERLRVEISEDIAWLFNDEDQPDPNTQTGVLSLSRFYVSRVEGTQDYHTFYNNFRLGGTRSRRELAFLEPYLQNDTYSFLFKKADPYMRGVLAYLNWMFFIPRLSLNFSLLYHHGWNVEKLSPLEANLDRSVRLRAHWTRFWFEVIPDLYWILAGLKICFWLPGGVMSPLGIKLAVTVQILDLLTSTARASIELYRLHKMAGDLNKVNCPSQIKNHMDKRFWFEALALGYMVFHFSILMISLCLTLPSMAAVSLMLPVVGAACSVLMTVITYHMQNYFNQRRAAEFEPRPKPLPESADGLRPNTSRWY